MKLKFTPGSIRNLSSTLMASLSIISSIAQTTFNYTGTIQTYTVPAGVTSISIDAYGAQGGTTAGGLGARIYGELTVVPGTVLNIVVGGQGVTNNCGGGPASGGGGGGSFVYDPANSTMPLIAAGGGGGGNVNWSGTCTIGGPGLATTNGGAGNGGFALGGINGNGGAGDAPSGTGSGGGGWLSAGQNSAYGTGCTGGVTLPTFIGGSGSTSFGPGGEGGFGGGGGAVCGCGGGGGYSGGGGGEGSSCRAGGGGGGSYNAGINQINTEGVRSGDGLIAITELVTCIPTALNPVGPLADLTDPCSVAEPTAPTTTNDCDVVVTGTTTTVFPVTTVGTTVVTWTFDDGEGNTATQTQNVIIPETTVTASGATLTADNTNIGVTYQWVDCNDGNAPIAGETGVSFTATENGSYAVEVTDGGCTQTSDCIVIDLSDLGEIKADMIKLYPNPATSVLTIESVLKGSVGFFDINGKLILSSKIKSGTNVINVNNLASGTYTLRVTTEAGIQTIQAAIKH